MIARCVSSSRGMAAEDSTCSSLMRELQNIWDEMGETDDERDRMLLQLEQECLDVYRRKVDQANCARARLHQLLADSESELASLQSLLGDRPCMIEKRSGTLRQQLMSVTPQIDVLRLRKDERVKQFQDVQRHIERLSEEISGVTTEADADNPAWFGEDLSLRRLHDYNSQLQALQNEKNNRLQKVLEHLKTLHGFCVLLGADYPEIAKGVHPSLDNSYESKNISDETLDRLMKAIDAMLDEKSRRMQKIQDLGASLVELWDLMDTPFEERQPFRNITRKLATSEQFSEPDSLSLKIIEQAESEVQRLNQLKVTTMKELVMKRQTELEEICKLAHMECDPSLASGRIASILDSGIVDPSELLATIEANIIKANEESVSRKDIMDRMEKWMGACEEESWLEEYSKDESRFNATRGAHLSLKRAERARVIVAKLPAMLESLKSKTRAWEEERERHFLFNGVSLLAMLDEYSLLRQEKEEAKRRLREEKKMQEQLQTEQELLYGTKNPAKRGQAGGGLRVNGNNANRRLSICPDFSAASKASSTATQGIHKGSKKRYPPSVLNYVALQKDEASSVASAESAPESPVAAS